MIKRVFITTGLLYALLANTVYAQNKVVVVPLGGDTYQLEVASADLFSWYSEIDTDELLTIVTVPAGKIFVVTQLNFVNVTGRFSLFENNTQKTLVFSRDSAPGVVSFGSGIPFASGSVVKVFWTSTAIVPDTDVTVIGHFSDAP